MANVNENSFLTLRQRLCSLLAVTEKEANALVLTGSTGIDTAAIGRRVGLERADVDLLVSSRTAIENARIDVNKVKQLQLLQVPHLAPERIRLVLEGHPYFSLEEFKEASGLPMAFISELFTAPELEFADKITGTQRRFEPIFGTYIAYPRLEFESTQLIESLGFIERPAGSNVSIRVIAPSDIEATKKTYELKRALGGQVFPVVRDTEGFDRYFVPASIDVWFRRDVPQQRALAVLNELGLRVKDSRTKVGYYQTDLDAYPTDLHVTAETIKKIHEIQNYTEIEFAEPTEVGFEDFKPENETQLPDFESSSGGSRRWNLEAIDLAAAHEIITGSPNVTILIVDSGILPDHQDLINALRPDWNNLDLNFDVGVPEAELSPLEQNIAHGTKVASVACGRGLGSESRVSGIAPECWLLPVKISGAPYGQSYGLRAAAIREAVSYVASGMRGVLNLSWSTNGEHLGVREALFEASDMGLAITTSAGNYHLGESQTPDKAHYPSQYAFLPGNTHNDVQNRRKIPGLASVAAVDAFKRKATYSYYGAHSVTVSAPGGEPGLAGVGIFVASTPEAYAYEAGTSFAAPHVAGLLALLFSAKPELTAQEAVDVVRITATDLDTDNPNFIGMLGGGLINARAALESLGISSSSSGTNTPTVELPSEDTSERLNINTATVEQLVSLPFIGEWCARKIVNYRKTNGPFATVLDLTQTGAVDSWTVDQIRHLITVD
jgi:competence ComEA-like helix-hairpin-helix protein